MNPYFVKGLALTIFGLLIGHGSSITLYQIHFNPITFLEITLIIIGLCFTLGCIAHYLMNRETESYENVQESKTAI